MKTNKRVLILDGESSFALSVVRCLGMAPGHQIYVLSSKKNCAIRFSKYVSKFYFYQNRANETLIERIIELVKNIKPDIIVPVDYPMLRALCSARLDLCDIRVVDIPELISLEIAADKGRFAEFCRKHQIDHPKSFRAEGSLEFLEYLNYPILFKPFESGYGVGIKKINSKNEAMRYIGLKNRENYIIQEFIDGYDIDCSVICRHGEIIAYTIQRSLIPGYYPFSSPAGVVFDFCPRVLTAVQKMLGVLRWNGIAHIDLRFDSKVGGYKIIEMNPRYWGSLLGSFSAGINFPQIAINIALGEEYKFTGFKRTCYVAGKAAVKWVASCNGPLDKTALKYIAKDPIPEIIDGSRKALTQIGVSCKKWTPKFTINNNLRGGE